MNALGTGNGLVLSIEQTIEIKMGFVGIVRKCSNEKTENYKYKVCNVATKIMNRMNSDGQRFE